MSALENVRRLLEQIETDEQRPQYRGHVAPCPEVVLEMARRTDLEVESDD